MHILKIILIALTLALVVTSIFQLTSGLGFALTLCPIFILVIILGYERALMFPGIRLEFLLETQFFLAGVISFLWIMAT
jgi:4-hydroxy-3-methylbut-2-enyl diphosphate reductase